MAAKKPAKKTLRVRSVGTPSPELAGAILAKRLKPNPVEASLPPAKAGTGQQPSTADVDSVSLMFDEVGDFSLLGVEAVHEVESAVRAYGPELLQSFEDIFSRIDRAEGLSTPDRHAILDCVFSIQESSSAIQAGLEKFVDIFSYRLKHQASFSAKRNAKKRAAADPKAQAMRSIEKAWDDAGRPDASKFASERAMEHQLRGIEITQGGIYNALRRYEKKSS